MSVTPTHLAQPLKLRHVTLRNRIVFGAHTSNMSEGGLPGERHLGYYLERARGGAAMIVVEPMPVHATAVLTRGNFRHGDDAVIPGFRAITDACHAQGAVMIHQLYHVGQHGDFDNSYQPSWSPSGLPSYHDNEGSHQMTEAEIEEIIAGFVDAADRAKRCGFDGIELFAAYNALIDQFWLGWSNRRDDQWGGSFENRMRFSHEIMRRIRERVGDQFVIGLAVSIDEGVAAALQIDELCEIVAWHDERQLMDYVTCGTGSYFSFDKIIPTYQQPNNLGIPYAERLKQVVRHAKVQAESHVRTAANAEAAVANGYADMVSIVRGQIADPHLANKALTGRAEEVRECISCNQMCWGRRSRDYWISCLVNPSVGREFEWGGDTTRRTAQPRDVLVVGGGPAGLETARVAAERGHRVSLVEAEPELGGAFRLAGRQPHRSQITDLLAWYERELQRLGVTVQTDSPMSASDVASTGADIVVIATGARPTRTGFQRRLPLVAELPGVHQTNVWAIEDVMAKRATLGNRVIILDEMGDWRGGGTAWHLADWGHTVTIVTPHAMVGAAVQRTAGDFELRSRLARLGVTWHIESAIVGWTGTAAIVRSSLDGSERTIEADALVLATTNTPATELLDELVAKGVDGYDLHTVGDVVAARSAVHAIYEARVLAMSL
ncbi:MAG: FAD-dependent oxidoreductase [Ilumatobacteraceae bacterium]